MIRDTLQNMKRSLILLLCLFALWSSLSADNHFGYTREKPLVIVCDWDFRPFEFINAEGQPAGYNVDVLNLILDQLDIPHQFVMQEWHIATKMFQRREADLIHALYAFYKDAPYVSTHKYINYYNLKLARRIDTNPLDQLNKLQPKDTLLLKEDDYAAMVLAQRDTYPFTIEYHSPKDALTSITQGKYKYFIWGEIPLSHKIQELGLDNIVLDDIDIPSGELRIIGYNKDLISIIDDQYTRLEQAGELQEVYDRWFHPERIHDDTSPVALYILAGLFLATVAVLSLIRIVRQRVSQSVQESSDLGQIMNQVLNMGDYFVVEWDFKNNMLRNKYGDIIPQGGMSPEEFLKRMPEEEGRQFHELNEQLASGIINHFDMTLRLNQGSSESPCWRTFYGNAIAERENSINSQSPGKLLYIVYTTKDITDELNENQRIKTITNKYKKMFDTNLVAMSFYDANGKLLDINQKMHEFCEVTDRNEQYFRTTSLFDFSNLKGVYLPGSREILHTCQHIYEPQMGLDKYTEFRVRPVINDNDELVFYIVTNRDITAERNIYLGQREHDRQLHTINKAAKHYEEQLCYLLKESKMYIWHYLPEKNIVNMSRTTGQTEFTETIEEYLETISPQAREKGMEEIRSAIQQGKPYNTILPFEHTLFDSEPTWYSISGIPIFNKDGQLTEYFGLSRNITELMEAQEKLRIETARAENSGRLKAAFLANMTHEIRTPLNAIVGFSDVLSMVDDANEKQEFIRIIRNNCDMLLRLISDILEVSDIDSRPLAIEPTDVDFAQFFNDICQTIEQRMQKPEVQFIKDNPYQVFNTRLDKGRIQQIITNFVTNAIKYTKEGHIKVGYRYCEGDDQQPGLYIYCEDTGTGIPKEKQASIFERFVKLDEFVQGTGLGLAISKSIVERCGGTIGVTSEGLGHGSTFWCQIPCEQNKD